jgi:hypothetical protein
MSFAVGACAPEGIDRHESVIMGQYFEGQPPQLNGGRLPAGDFVLQGVELWFPSYDLGVAVLDPELSFYDAAGALELDEDGNFALDLQGETNLISVSGAQFTRAINVSFNGVFQSNNDGGASVTAQLSCPEEGQFSFVFEQSLNEMGEPEGELIMYFSFSSPVDGVQVMRFSRR